MNDQGEWRTGQEDQVNDQCKWRSGSFSISTIIPGFWLPVSGLQYQHSGRSGYLGDPTVWATWLSSYPAFWATWLSWRSSRLGYLAVQFKVELCSFAYCSAHQFLVPWGPRTELQKNPMDPTGRLINGGARPIDQTQAAGQLES